MDFNYMQLLAAAAAMPAPPSHSTSAAIGQQSQPLNPPPLLQNPWLQQQYLQRLALQRYLESVATPSISSLILPTTLPSVSVPSTKYDDTIIASLLDMTPVSTTTYLPAANDGLVVPVAKRARLVLPTISDEDQKRLLEQQPQIASEPTVAVPADSPHNSSVQMPSAFTPNVSHPASPTVESALEVRCSPSTSVDTSANAKEDDEPELFIDIESVDNRPEGRDRRKAYIDFYRKVKNARQRERGPLLNCALCDCQVLSNDNAIHTHVNHHADAGGFWCKLCGLSEIDKYRIYEHMRVNHPNNLELFEDRRDIVKLCAVIQECFPRVCSKFKKENCRELGNIIKSIEEKNMKEIKCARCEMMVKASKAALTKHANQHPVYRCKTCQYTSESLEMQEKHQVGLHTALDPKVTVDYYICTAAEVLTRTVQSCFSHVLHSSDNESQDEKAASKKT